MKDRTILLIDDDSTVRELVGHYLRKQEFNVVIAHNALNALAILESLTPDLILVDLIMPGMDGVEFILKLRKTDRFKNLPVIMMTSEKNPEFLLEAATLKLAGLLIKPVSEKLLLQKTNAVFKT
jgi:CheY-like chemotaxis protein